MSIETTVATIDERTKNTDKNVDKLLKYIEKDNIRIGIIEVEQGKQGTTLKHHSKFIIGSFSLSGLLGFALKIFIPGKG